jgi:hypothetical protein
MNNKDTSILNNLIKELGALTSSRADRIYQANEGSKQRTHDYKVLEAQLVNALTLQEAKERGMNTRTNTTETGLTTRNDRNAESADFAAEKNFQGIQDTNMTNEEIATIRALAVEYQADKLAETQMYGSDKSLEGIINTNDAQKYSADKSLLGVKNTNSANKYMAETQADSQNYISDNQLAGTEYQADAGERVAKYGIEAQQVAEALARRRAKEKEASNYQSQFDLNAEHTVDAIEEESDFWVAASDISNGWAQDKNKIAIDIQQLTELGVPRTDPRWENVIMGLQKYKDTMSEKGYLDGGFNLNSGEMEKMNLRQVENMIRDLQN